MCYLLPYPSMLEQYRNCLSDKPGQRPVRAQVPQQGHQQVVRQLADFQPELEQPAQRAQGNRHRRRRIRPEKRSSPLESLSFSYIILLMVYSGLKDRMIMTSSVRIGYRSNVLIGYNYTLHEPCILVIIQPTGPCQK